jgi:hypothetical protein
MSADLKQQKKTAKENSKRKQQKSQFSPEAACARSSFQRSNLLNGCFQQ